MGRRKERKQAKKNKKKQTDTQQSHDERVENTGTTRGELAPTINRCARLFRFARVLFYHLAPYSDVAVAPAIGPSRLAPCFHIVVEHKFIQPSAGAAGGPPGALIPNCTVVAPIYLLWSPVIAFA